MNNFTIRYPAGFRLFLTPFLDRIATIALAP